MQRPGGTRRRTSLSLPILRTTRNQHRAGTLTLGNLLKELGETSFGWAIVIFSLLALLPLPPGSSLVTALPLLVTTVQMMLGYPHVILPGPLIRMRIDPMKLRRAVMRLRPIIRRLERLLTPRYATFFARRNERAIGLALFLVAFALFLPVPFSGWFPAISLFVFGVALVERDGLVAMIALAFGGASVLLTGIIIITLARNTEALF